MKKQVFFNFFLTITLGAILTSCVSSTGLDENVQKDVPTKLWYDNATLLIEANDPDLKADTFIGVPKLDAIVDSVKDILVQVPAWTVTKVEEKHFNTMYMESAESLNAGADGADLVVKGEAFKTALLLDVFAQEAAHAKAAVGLDSEAKKENYAQNAQIYEEALAKANDYASKQVYPFVSAGDQGDDARREFFAAPERQQWNERIEEIVQQIKTCVVDTEDKAQIEAAKTELKKAFGVQEVNWREVVGILAEDLAKLTQASSDFTDVMRNDADLQAKITRVPFGGEIVEGVSGKETLAVIKRVGKQMKVNIKLLQWLIDSIGE